MISGCHLGSFIYLLMMPALCSQWIMGSKYRTKLRKRYNLVEAPYTDIVSHIFCPCCSLCQEFRELKIRGLDPALGISAPSFCSSLFNFTFLIIIWHNLLQFSCRMEWNSCTKACKTAKRSNTEQSSFKPIHVQVNTFTVELLKLNWVVFLLIRSVLVYFFIFWCLCLNYKKENKAERWQVWYDKYMTV